MAFLPKVLVKDNLEAGTLVRLDWEPGPHETTVFMIRHAGKWRSPLVKRFMGIAREVVRGDAPLNND